MFDTKNVTCQMHFSVFPYIAMVNDHSNHVLWHKDTDKEKVRDLYEGNRIGFKWL